MNRYPSEDHKQTKGPLSEDYHDYVFRDGKLLGDFDGMYRHAKETPWHQDKTCDLWSTEVGMLMIRDRAPYDAILEVGCGLGYIAAKLKQVLAEREGRIDAFDLSPVAIKKAKTLHQGIDFYVDTVADPKFKPKQQYGLVVVKELFWFVSDQIRTVAANIDRCVTPNGLLYIGQAFPALDSPFVGKEVIPTPERLMEHFPNYEPVYTGVLRNHLKVNDGPVFHFLGVRRT